MSDYEKPIVAEEDDGLGGKPASVVVAAAVVLVVVFAVGVLNQGLTISNYSTHTTYLK